ncbi:hypothetical protein AUJ84_00815 [Candidatus Pacearchaeota archaeon CG1_02_32_132]|nr:MAG: hypothetical protein AUJ84_00815 [Candidatus Pacearchaeota archaeon CG1_02_32_132]
MIKREDEIKVEYEGRFEDGTVFDSSKIHKKPLEFTVGSNQVILGFDKAVLGMKEGEEKEFTVEPEEGYRDYKEDLKKEIPKDIIKGKEEPKPGMVLIMGTPDGGQFPVVVKAVTGDKIIVDFNHPLAGKKLIFKIKVLEVASGGKVDGIEGRI